MTRKGGMPGEQPPKAVPAGADQTTPEEAKPSEPDTTIDIPTVTGSIPDAPVKISSRKAGRQVRGKAPKKNSTANASGAIDTGSVVKDPDQTTVSTSHSFKAENAGGKFRTMLGDSPDDPAIHPDSIKTNPDYSFKIDNAGGEFRTMPGSERAVDLTPTERRESLKSAIEELKDLGKTGEGQKNAKELVADQQKRILDLARATRGEAYAEKFSAEFASGSKTNAEHYLQSAAKAEAMLLAEKEYLALASNFHKTKGFHKVVADRFIDTESALTSKEFKAAKARWQASRAEYLGFMSGSVEKRFEKKHASEGDASHKKEVMERYERRHGARVIKEAYLDAENAEVNSRIEALDSRSKGTIEKWFDKYKNLPAYVRVPATYAVITAASASIAAIGGGLALIPILVSTTAIGVQTGLHLLAARQKNPEIKARLEKAAAFAGVAGAAGIIGGGTIREFHRLLGTKERSAESLNKKAAITDAADSKAYLALIKERQKAHQAVENIERHAAIGGTVASIGAGAMLGHELHNLGSHHHDVVATHESHSVPHSESTHGVPSKFMWNDTRTWHWPFGKPHETATDSHHGHGKLISADSKHSSESHESGHASGVHQQTPTSHESLSIHGKINDADRLIGHFGKQLQDRFHDSADAPPAVKKLFELLHTKGTDSLLKGEDHATSLLGLHRHGGALMHEGDTVSLNDKGEIVIHPAGHPEHSHVLIDSKGEVHQLPEHDWKFPSEHAHTAHETHAAENHQESPTAHTHDSESRSEEHKENIYAYEHAHQGFKAHEAEHLSDAPTEQSGHAGAAHTEPGNHPAPDNNGPVSLNALEKGDTSAHTTASHEAADPNGPISLKQLEHSQENQHVSHSPNIFKNSFNVEIDRTHAAGYEWKLPNSSEHHPYFYGGSPQRSLFAAWDHLAKHPHETVYVDQPTSDPVTGAIRHHVNAYTMGANGKPEPHFDAINPATGRPFTPPDPQTDFVGKLGT